MTSKLLTIKLILCGFLTFPSQASNEDEERNIVTMPRLVIENIFGWLGTDQNRYAFGATCRDLWEEYNSRDRNDEECEHVLRMAIAPDARSSYLKCFPRIYLNLFDRIGRLLFRSQMRIKYGSMQTFLDSNDYAGAFNNSFLDLLLTCNDPDPDVDVLNLAGQNLKMLPDEIEQLAELREINLNGNKLTEISHSFTKLARLTRLQARDNLLTRLPHNFHNLTWLTIIHLDHNRLSEFPTVLLKMQNLVTLSLERNQLTNIPSSISKLSKLSYLNISYNRIRYLPLTIYNMRQLRTLYVDHNQLNALPTTIVHLPRLETLWVGSNNLAYLPYGFTELKSLRSLTIDHNRIRDLPEEMRNLKLKFIWIHKNPPMRDHKGYYPDWICAWAAEIQDRGDSIML